MTSKRLETIIMAVMFLGAGMISGWALDSSLHITSKIHDYRVTQAAGQHVRDCSAYRASRMMLINPDAELDTCQVIDDRPISHSK